MSMRFLLSLSKRSLCLSSISLILSFLTKIFAFAQPQTSIEEAGIAVLQKNCVSCHSEPAMSNLDLRQRETMLKGGTRGPAVVPGKAEESLLYRAAAHSGELKMPPGGTGLSAQEREGLRGWRTRGAQWGG